MFFHAYPTFNQNMLHLTPPGTGAALLISTGMIQNSGCPFSPSHNVTAALSDHSPALTQHCGDKRKTGPGRIPPIVKAVNVRGEI